jgi:perosamine synthetase
MKNINFFPVSMPSITEKEVSYVNDVMLSGWVSSLGPCIDKFEQEFAKYCGVKYALTASNGTTGLQLALLALNIGAGDEVIVPDLTFVATANAVVHAGATPVIVDITSDNLCICPDAIRKAITPNTKAIMPVHLYGHPCDMDAINNQLEMGLPICIELDNQKNIYPEK